MSQHGPYFALVWQLATAHACTASGLAHPHLCCLFLQEVAILSRVENATESLLARCFENYYSLQENAPSGLLDGGVAAAEQPAPALQPAVELCNILRDVLKPGDQQWLTDRFWVAANRRYHRLLDGADATISRGALTFLLPLYSSSNNPEICVFQVILLLSLADKQCCPPALHQGHLDCVIHAVLCMS